MNSHRERPRLRGTGVQYLPVARKEPFGRGDDGPGLDVEGVKDTRYPSQRLTRLTRLTRVVSIFSRFSIDDSPYTTEFILEEGAAGNSEEPAMVVFDGIENAKVHCDKAPFTRGCVAHACLEDSKL